MAHRHEHLCSTSQLWLPHPALCIVPPECFRGLRIWSGAMGSKSGKLWNIADRDSAPFLGLRTHETLGWTSPDFLIYRPISFLGQTTVDHHTPRFPDLTHMTVPDP